jgi:hypothetical protein
VEMKNRIFNWRFKVVFEDGMAWVVRFPVVADNVMHAEEMDRREVGVIKFIKEETNIPVPVVIQSILGR